MQIRLTVLGPSLGGHAAHACDVLVTAPAGTALAGVTSGLAAVLAAAGSDLGTGAVAVYAGTERLDAQRCALGEPPLIDGAVLSLGTPADPERHPTTPLALPAETTARLHVVSGPDAGGVHLLHGGEVRIGRSSAADIPVDDPDVSRLHCAVTLGDDGRVTLHDLGSTNGTTLDATPVDERPVPFRPGALLRAGESTLVLHGPDGTDGRSADPAPAPGTTAEAPGSPLLLPTSPDGEGHLRVTPRAHRPTAVTRTDVPGPRDGRAAGGTGGTAAAAARYASPRDAGGSGPAGSSPPAMSGGRSAPSGTDLRGSAQERPETPGRAARSAGAAATGRTTGTGGTTGTTGTREPAHGGPGSAPAAPGGRPAAGSAHAGRHHETDHSPGAADVASAVRTAGPAPDAPRPGQAAGPRSGAAAPRTRGLPAQAAPLPGGEGAFADARAADPRPSHAEDAEDTAGPGPETGVSRAGRIPAHRPASAPRDTNHTLRRSDGDGPATAGGAQHRTPSTAGAHASPQGPAVVSAGSDTRPVTARPDTGLRAGAHGEAAAGAGSDLSAGSGDGRAPSPAGPPHGEDHGTHGRGVAAGGSARPYEAPTADTRVPAHGPTAADGGGASHPGTGVPAGRVGASAPHTPRTNGFAHEASARTDVGGQMSDATGRGHGPSAPDRARGLDGTRAAGASTSPHAADRGDGGRGQGAGAGSRSRPGSDSGFGSGFGTDSGEQRPGRAGRAIDGGVATPPASPQAGASGQGSRGQGALGQGAFDEPDGPDDAFRRTGPAQAGDASGRAAGTRGAQDARSAGPANGRPGSAGATPAVSDGRGSRVTGAGSTASRVPTTADSERSTHARGFRAETGTSGGASRPEGAEALDAARRAVAHHGDLTSADSRRAASGAGVHGQARAASGAGAPGAGSTASRGHAPGAGLSPAGRTDTGTTETATPANGVRHGAGTGTGTTGAGTTGTGTARFAATSTADDPCPTHLPGHSGRTTPHVPQQPRAEHRDTAPVTGSDAPSGAGRPSWATGHLRPHAASTSGADRTPGTDHAPGTAREADPAHAPAAPTTDHRGAAHLRSPASDASGTAHPAEGGPGGQHRTDALAARTPRITARIPAEPEAAGDAPAPGAQTLYADGSPAAPAPAPSPDATEPGPEPAPAPGKRPRGRGIAAWARRLTGGRGDRQPQTADTGGTAAQPPITAVVADTGPGRADARGAAADAASLRERWPDPAAVLLTALGPGPRLWERGPDHPDQLTVRLGTADRYAPAPDTATGRTLLPAVPVTVALRQAGSLGLAGPRGRLAGLARSALAHLAALHSPSVLEFVLIAADPARPADRRQAEWAWLGWLPHLRPAHGQDCRLLVAYDREQAAARVAELVRRLDDGPLGPGWPTAPPEDVAAAADRHPGPYTVVIVDGDPGTSALRETVARLAARGAAAGVHLVCLAEAPATTASSPVPAALETAAAGSPAFPHCGAVALLGGDVATVVQVIERTARPGDRSVSAPPPGGSVVAAVDAVSGAWAERFARALAPLRVTDADPAGRSARVAALPRTARLLDELGLARATPASLTARWAEATDPGSRPGGRAVAVLGAGPHGPLAVDLAADGPHLLVEGGPGSGKTELLRSLAASLAAADRPDRLSLVLVDGAAAERGEGLRVCTDLPHVSTYLAASDPVRMREFAQALGSELKRRAELLGTLDFAAWHERHTSPPPQVVPPRRSADPSSGDLDSPPTGTLRLRPARGGDSAARTAETALPRLVVLVDDYDALVAPALGSTGRPAAGSVVRALEAVARDGERLGIHLVAASGRPDRTEGTEAAERAALRVALEIAPAEAGAQGDGGPAPGRGRLRRPDDEAATPFQAGRVTGRIPRTATLRPTVVPLDWQRMGDPPTRRPVRELGNGPTDLALLASALQRAAQSAGARPAPPLL